MAYRDIVGSFWYLHDQAFLKFSRVIQLPHYGVHRYDPDISEAFDLFSKLWKMQKEYRWLLEQNGLERWEIGQIAFRIGQLYVGQYLKNGDTKNLFEAYLSYKAIMDHGYLLDTSINLEIHFLVHFFLLCLMLGRHEMVHLIAAEIKDLYNGFLEEEPMEWKQSFKEIERFHEVDRSFMNMRPLRYSFAFDPHPNSIPNLASGGKERAPILHVAIILGYHPNEVKFGEITLDSLRMLQCLEWEPCGEFAETTRGEGIQGGNSSPNLLQDIRDMSLPPNPQKLIFYRPSITLFLMVITTAWNELPSDKVLLIYLSAGGEGELSLVPSNSRPSSESCGRIMHSFSNIEISYTATSTNKSPVKSSSQRDCSKLQSEPCLWLGPHESEGSNFLYPSDLIPFTRRSLFLVIDSKSSYAFKLSVGVRFTDNKLLIWLFMSANKAIHGAEKGKTTAMLLSPTSQPPTIADSAGHDCCQNGSQFTMFLTAPVQAFCILTGHSMADISKDTFNTAEELLSLSLIEWGTVLLASPELDEVWIDVLRDPLLWRLLLRFIFCRAVLALFKPTNHEEEFLPTCLPQLPESVLPQSEVSQSSLKPIASLFEATDHFDFK